MVGRGGEGVVLASQLLADALSRAGFSAQCFPEFKAERRGAPISAFLRWDDVSSIHRRYRLREWDVLVGLSPAPPSPELLRAVRPGGLVVLNRDARLPLRGGFAIARVPASRIAREDGVLSAEGRPMGNVAMLGACVRLLLPDRLDVLEQAIEARMGDASAANLAAARRGYALCRRQRSLLSDPVLVPLGDGAEAAAVAVPLFPVSSTDSIAVQTGSWALERPVLRDACSACAVCALFCPEGAIHRADGGVEIDYRFCKGCGICELVCPLRDAIVMEEVSA